VKPIYPYLFLSSVVCLLVAGLRSSGDDPPTCDQKCRIRYVVYTDTPAAYYQYEDTTCEFCVVNGPIQGTCKVQDENDTGNFCVVPPMGALATTRKKVNAFNACAIVPKAPGVERRTEAKDPVTMIPGEMPVAADKTECVGPATDPDPPSVTPL